MSGSTDEVGGRPPTDGRRSRGRLGGHATRRPSAAALRRSLAGSLSAVSFWVAILLPVLYLSLLFSGIETLAGLAVFLALFGLHVLALVGGRGHADARGA